MATRDNLIEALNACIDRLNQGEPLEDVLQDYPALANQLRPMLEAGLLFPRSRIPLAEVETAQAAGEAAIRQTVHQVFRGLPGMFWLVIVMLMFTGGIVLWMATGDDDNEVMLPPTATVTETSTATLTATLTATITASMTWTPSATPVTPTSTATVTQTASPTATVTASVTWTPSATPVTPTTTATSTATITASVTHTPTQIPPIPSATMQPTDAAQIPPGQTIIVIEGPVDEVDDDGIKIYGITIVIDDDDPLLRVIRVGDVVRVEGERNGDTIRVISIVVINVVVVVQDGQVWRGDDCSIAPPFWAEDDADDWYARCGSAPSIGDGSGDDDFDDNDDDLDDDLNDDSADDDFGDDDD